jgi:hypothetical protein
MVKCYICGHEKPARFTGTVHYIKGKSICPGCWKKYGLGSESNGGNFELKAARDVEQKKAVPSKEVPKVVKEAKKEEAPKKSENKKEEKPAEPEKPKEQPKEEPKAKAEKKEPEDSSLSWF